MYAKRRGGGKGEPSPAGPRRPRSGVAIAVVLGLTYVKSHNGRAEPALTSFLRGYFINPCVNVFQRAHVSKGESA